MRTKDRRQLATFCGFCIARCGAIATIENGRFTRLDSDPTHPTGSAICAKGRAAPEITYSRNRLTHPLRRTNPKTARDPGWKQISWDEALDEIATRMTEIAQRHGPQAIAFSQSSTSPTAIEDSANYIRRLMNAFGTPNLVSYHDLCGWGRSFATRYAYGVGTVAVANGGGMPEIDRSGCLILWGYNPSSSRRTHANATAKAVKRGMKLIVIDPRNLGLTNKADVWLRVRPGTDGALALGLANLMIERGWYDAAFIRDWTNGPLLVRSDTGRLLREADVFPSAPPGRLLAWDEVANAHVAFDPSTGKYDRSARLALEGEYSVAIGGTPISCRPVFDHYAELCRRYSPDVVEKTCWIEKGQLEETARLLWHARPVSYYAWSGHEQHANTTETARAMSLLYALTGSFDAPGGNVLLPAVPRAPVTGEDLLSTKDLAPAIGMSERPLGPARWNNVSALNLYRAILEGTPYPVRGLIGFGANLLLSHSDPDRGREALSTLEFYAHADLFMNPTASLADIILPIASCFEREGLKIGFEVSNLAQSLVQLRQAVAPPPGEARPDIDVVFGLAKRLGLGEHFWNGDIDESYRYQLRPSGVALEALRANPSGIRVPLETRYHKHAELDDRGVAKGFATPSRKIEIWSEVFQEHGYSALPEFVEPATGPVSRPDLQPTFPLVLTCAKQGLFCQTQHRGMPSLRRRAPNPEVELHPDTATQRGITAGAWVVVSTSSGSMRAVARLNDKLDRRVVIGEHGWWEPCEDLGLAGYDPFSNAGANFNRTINPNARDPVSGTPEHRANLCQVQLAPSPAVSGTCSGKVPVCDGLG